jgi:ubiquinone/menaquinone biosynthesis C-methylase UbiE
VLHELHRRIGDLPGTAGFTAQDEDGCATTLRWHADALGLAGVPVAGATVLDAGCGHGEPAVALAVLGARRVLAVDVGDDEIACVRAIARGVPELAPVIEPIQASVFDLPVADRAVDLLLATENLGVFADLGAFLDEVARVLRPGGAAVLVEGNDVANPRLRARARRLWRHYEQGPPGELHGHHVEVPYVEQRAALARQELPDAPQDVVRAIAENTFRADAAQVRAACAAWRATGRLPARPFDPSLAPGDLHGLLVEAPVDPGWMLDALAARGLQGRAVGYWGGADGRAPVRAVNRLLQRLGRPLLPTATGVRYVATKPA